LVKVDGHKVDPAEVELALLELPGVREAVVFGIANGAGQKIKAVLVSNSTAVTQTQVRDHLRSRLADFKHPGIIEFRRELPRGPSGKVLRKHLNNQATPDSAKHHLELCTRLGIRSEDAVSGRGALHLSMLPPFLRVLLVTDGTVTRTLEAYFGELIGVDVLSHAELCSEQSLPHIGVLPGDRILRRRIILRGLVTQTAYAFAESVVVTACISADLRRALIEERKGIGELLASGRMETFRELLAVERTRAAPWAAHLGIRPDDCVATRRYVVFREGRAAIQIEEVFPERAFLPECPNPTGPAPTGIGM
jgi:chorismate-pyruvate lyase